MTQATLYAKLYDEAGYHIFSRPYFEMHKHNQYELVLVTKGSVVHTINGRVEVLRENDLVFITPKDEHSFSKYKNENCTHYNFFMNINLFETYTEMLYPSFNEHIKSNHLPYMVYHLSENQKQSILQAATAFNHSSFSHNYNSEKKFVVMGAFFEWMKITAPLLNQPKSIPEWLSAFLIKLQDPENFIRPINELYAMTGYSANQLQRLFKQYMNMTLVQYIKNQRLYYAAKLLKEEDYSILFIANTVGYSSLSYFNHEFKKLFKVIPSYYRKSKAVATLT